MKHFPTLILRCAVFVAGSVVLAMCGGTVWLASVEVDYVTMSDYLIYILLAGVFSASIPFFIALYQAYRLLGYIDTDRAFSELSVKSLKIITRCSLAVFAVCTAGGLPFFYYWAQSEDAPGLVLFGMAIAGAAFVITVFASVLSRLFQDALAMKAENDLTV